MSIREDVMVMANQSEATGLAAREAVNVSASDRAKLRRAIEALSGGSDPRLEGLVSKLAAIESPEGDGGSELAKTLDLCERLSKSESLKVREMAADASFELQRSHLQKHSAGYTIWRDSALKAGRIRD
jgi:hypothetical protein